MKKWISISLLAIFLLGNTPLKELVKVPLLIEHFIKHKQENKKINLLEFLSMHYFNGDPMDDDYAQDMKLPFKTLDCSYANTLFSFNEPSIFFAKTPKIIEPKALTSIYKSKQYASKYSNVIWQPPKFS